MQFYIKIHRWLGFAKIITYVCISYGQKNIQIGLLSEAFMKEILKKIDGNKLLLTIQNELFEKEAILNTSYKFTNTCFINIESIGDNTEVYFQAKELNQDLEKTALNFGNELIDQQVRLNTGREFKVIREELLKKAFSSITKSE